MSPALAVELALLSLSVFVFTIFSIWRIASDVRKIREHFDRVDKRWDASVVAGKK